MNVWGTQSIPVTFDGLELTEYLLGLLEFVSSALALYWFIMARVWGAFLFPTLQHDSGSLPAPPLEDLRVTGLVKNVILHLAARCYFGVGRVFSVYCLYWFVFVRYCLSTSCQGRGGGAIVLFPSHSGSHCLFHQDVVFLYLLLLSCFRSVWVSVCVCQSSPHGLPNLEVIPLLYLSFANFQVEDTLKDALQIQQFLIMLCVAGFLQRAVQSS